MKTLSIAPVVPPLRWRNTLPSSKLLNYFVLALTFLYLTLLVAGCWAVVHVFWQWTTDTCLKGFPMA